MAILYKTSDLTDYVIGSVNRRSEWGNVYIHFRYRVTLGDFLAAEGCTFQGKTRGLDDHLQDPTWGHCRGPRLTLTIMAFERTIV